MSDSEASSERSEPEPLKKRQRRSKTYKRNVIKMSKVKGLQHINWSGNIIPARVTGPDCMCKMSCFERLTREDLDFCIDKINGFLNKNEQDIYLQQLIEKDPVKCHRFRKEGAIPRVYHFKYCVHTQNKKETVCKKAFTSIYGITENRVRRLSTLLQQSITPHDERGQHQKVNTTPPTVLKAIHDHILDFPRKRTHYSGKEIEYLDARLDVKTMHAMFRKKFPELKVTYAFYANYFKTTFFLRFGRPQIDTCIECEELEVKIKSPTLGFNAKKAFEAEKAVHNRRAKKFHNKIAAVKQICTSQDDVACLTFDFMQNLPLPHLPIQEIFYLRQLWVNCFGIKNLKTNETVFYVYHEGIAKKGANEVCSMLLHYMDNFLGENINEVILFSDNCPGQNKNHTVIRFLLSLTDTGRFSKVTHYFPIRGHSFLPNDRDFGVVKKKIKKCDRIYVPNEYYKIMSEASPNFKVFMLSTEQILDFAKWWPKFYKKVCLSDESFGKHIPKELKQSFSLSCYMAFQYDKNRKGVVVVHEFIDGLRRHTFDLTRNKASAILLPTENAYPAGSVPINPKKIENIKQVKNSVIQEHIPFYEGIFNWPTGEENDGPDVENDEEFDYVP